MLENWVLVVAVAAVRGLCAVPPRRAGQACWRPRIVGTLLLEYKAVQVPVTGSFVGGESRGVSEESAS